MAAVLCCWLLTRLATAQPASASDSASDSDWIVATVEGSTYRATKVRELPEGAVQIQVRGGRQITIAASRLAKVWPDSDTTNQPADRIVQTTCARSELQDLIVRDLIFRNQTEPPIRARILYIDPGRILRYQRMESIAAEERAWADLDEIRRPEGLLDPCKAAPPPADLDWPARSTRRVPKANRKGGGLIIAGSILLGHGLPMLVVFAHELRQGGPTDLTSGIARIGGTVIGAVVTTLGVSLLIPGLVQYTK